MYAPMVSYTYSGYLAIAIIAALDSVFGGIVATLKKNFNLTIFITGFFGNAILAILLTILGQKLNVDIYKGRKNRIKNNKIFITKILQKYNKTIDFFFKI